MSAGAPPPPSLTEAMRAALDASKVDPTGYELTDAGNALLFAALFSRDLKYVEAWGSWAFWNCWAWVRISDTEIFPLARQLTEYMFEWAITLPGDERDRLRKHALKTQSVARLSAMIDLAKGEPVLRAKPDQFDANPWLLNCKNKTLDLKNNKFYRPRRKDMMTKSTNVVFDKTVKSPNWDAFLTFVLQGDVATIETLQRLAGYMLTGSVSEEQLFAFFGTGANGKTTVAMTLFEALGDYAYKASSDLLMSPQGERGAASPDIAILRGHRLALVSETGDNCAIAEAQVKAITSNKPIAARELYRDSFTFMPAHKLLLMTNNRPIIKGMDDGIWRRFLPLEFKARIADEDKNPHFREESLRPELPGILNWMIRRCMKWQRDGLKPSPAVTSALNSYRQEMDFIQQWLDENTTRDATASTTRKEAYIDYWVWSREQHSPTVSSRRFVEELHNRGFLTRKSHGDRLFCGLRLGARHPHGVVAKVAIAPQQPAPPTRGKNADAGSQGPALRIVGGASTKP